MKMIASTKLAKAQRAMQTGKQYGEANTGARFDFLCSPIFRLTLFHHAEVFKNAEAEDAGKKKLFLVISSDKGLCGGIHSAVTKATRRAFKEGEVESDTPIMVIGDKSKAQLSRALGGNLVLTFNQIGRDIPTFADAAGVADLITKSGVKYDEVNIVYNKFVSAISYEPAVMKVTNEESLKDARE